MNSVVKVSLKGAETALAGELNLDLEGERASPVGAGEPALGLVGDDGRLAGRLVGDDGRLADRPVGDDGRLDGRLVGDEGRWVDRLGRR